MENKKESQIIRRENFKKCNTSYIQETYFKQFRSVKVKELLEQDLKNN